MSAMVCYEHNVSTGLPIVSLVSGRFLSFVVAHITLERYIELDAQTAP